MTPAVVEHSPESAFQPGERVFVARGTYQGTLGHFVGLTQDHNWAEVLEEAKNIVLTHPVAWLKHCPEGALDWSKLLHAEA